ncbi:MAG TPA: signal recognition particle protein [Firmicutes bacterium]|jgi:signal recognition particle subunit SRP54|nr:signal recognition particle protein [Bacillota bacterium]
MFDNLSEKLDGIISKVKGYGTITEDNISEMVREVRLALLEADVNYKIVGEFVNKVKESVIGENVTKSLKPGEVFVSILRRELVELLGSDESPLIMNNDMTIVLMCGLQGSGKTTTTGKLGNLVRKKFNKKPMFIACDVYRPAAIEQLKTLGKSLNIEVYDEGKGNPEEISKRGIEYAKSKGYDYVLIDTAGRLQLDEVLMEELVNINNEVHANEILLVIDAMMGQDAINVITGFNEKLPLTGCILTKMDGDTKGGVALSLRHLTNIPIKYIGDSEKLDGLSEFVPSRIADRILGYGDILSIAEKASSVIDEEEARNAAKKMKKGNFDLEDFLSQLKQIKKLGPLENILKLLPGARKMGLNNISIDPKVMARIEAIILSMTPYERTHPEVLKASRKQRIAKGSATSVQEVNKLLTQFEEMKKMMKQLSNGNMKMPF